MEKETAMKILKELHGKSLFAERTALETLIPELKESEDEKIRKTLIEYFNAYPKDYYCELKKSDILSFLKKQKPTFDTNYDRIQPQPKQEWSEEEKRMLNGVIGSLEVLQDVSPERMPIVDKEIQWLKSLKNGVQPQTKEWSEEDEEMIEDLIKGCISAEKTHHLVHTSKEIADWLKSIKDRMQGKEKIIYFKPYFDADAMEEMSDAEVLDCAIKRPKDVVIYNTFEGFAEAFNNGYISDEGWIRKIKYENT